MQGVGFWVEIVLCYRVKEKKFSKFMENQTNKYEIYKPNLSLYMDLRKNKRGLCNGFKETWRRDH